MQRNREYFKNLLAENETDTLVDELFTLFSFHKMRFKDRRVDDKYDTLVLLSGKLNAARESHQLGMTSVEEFGIETNRINSSILEMLNDLPDTFFEQAKDAEQIVPGKQKEIQIPTGISNGLFWMASVFVMMIGGGLAIQGNWLPFAFTLAAIVICFPPSYHFLARSLSISLSNSIRILLVIVLTFVGLSLVPKNARNLNNTELPTRDTH